MKVHGRPILGAISGLFFGFFLGLELVFFKVLPMGTLTTVVLPLAGLAIGLVLGFTGPFGKGKAGAGPPVSSPAPAE